MEDLNYRAYSGTRISQLLLSGRADPALNNSSCGSSRLTDGYAAPDAHHNIGMDGKRSGVD